ncbi:MAG: YoaP domain-containing protein [Methanobacteriota archaeon]
MVQQIISFMDNIEIIDITPDNISDYGVCGYKDLKKHEELRRKIAWFTEYYPKGLRMKVLFSKKDGYQGMIEYLPGIYTHRPVDADGYLVIQCIFTGFRKEYKGKGYGSLLITECITDAQKENLAGVAVVTRNGSFMARRDIFLKLGFVVVDSAAPNFELLVYRFDPSSPFPGFKPDLGSRAAEYPDGLTIFRSAQCPYSVKNVQEIMETARNTFHLTPHLIELDGAKAVQQSPCAFGTFCILYNGTVISHHPISNTRFVNIMKKLIPRE